MLEIQGKDEPIERIKYNGVTYAVLVRAKLPRTGYNFVSQDEDSLQVGVNHYKSGQLARPHFHLPAERALKDTLEMLHIDSGACLLSLYNDAKVRVYETRMESGDTVVLLAGGHALQMLDDTRIVEVKQGPYLGPARDKVFFEEEKG